MSAWPISLPKHKGVTWCSQDLLREGDLCAGPEVTMASPPLLGPKGQVQHEHWGPPGPSLSPRHQPMSLSTVRHYSATRRSRVRAVIGVDPVLSSPAPACPWEEEEEEDPRPRDDEHSGTR